MKTSTPARFAPALLLLLLALACPALSPSAQAQTGTPQNPFVITAAPYTVTQSGYYILGTNLNFSATTGNIITVNASNVTLDFNNFYIAGPVGNAGQTVNGVSANERSNVTIKNGTVAYCYYGINIGGNGQANTNNVGQRIDTMRVTYCTFVGINVASSPSSVISNCQVSKTTGSTVVSSSGFGIFLSGDGATVADCSVGDITASGTNFCISVSTGAIAVRNRLANATYGIFSNGAKYQNNLAINCTTPFSGATDAGGNN